MGFADFFEKILQQCGKGPIKNGIGVGSCQLLTGCNGTNKNDIIHVLSKYVEIDLEGLDIKIEQTESEGNNGMVPALFANIPIKDMKHSSGNKNK